LDDLQIGLTILVGVLSLGIAVALIARRVWERSYVAQAVLGAIAIAPLLYGMCAVMFLAS
jgi:hypothetical protein